MTFDISVIIPTFNVEEYIIDALESVNNQTFKGNIELIIIDDCSTDNTLEKVQEFKNANPQLPIKIFAQNKNMKQGAARNRGIKESKGKYVFFLDGDDFLDSQTFEKMFLKAEKESCDFVVCDWMYFYKDKGFVYVNNDTFLSKDLLVGPEVELLYSAETYFSVNKLYNRDFLIKNNIKYGEGYIYEDFEFYILVAQYANRVGIVSNPFYKVRVNENSTTKSNLDTLLHVESLEKAIKNSIENFSPRAKYSYYHVYKYLIRKTLSYIDTRAPKKYKKKTLSKIVTLLNNNNTNYDVPNKVVALYHFLFRRKYLQNHKINHILFIWWLHKKGKLKRVFNVLVKIKRATIIKIKNKIKIRKVLSFYKQPIEKNTILFLGFDYRYTGNSKYLFDYLKDKKDIETYFVTNNRSVPDKNRIAPRSMEFYKKLATSKIVLVESWVPLAYKKREGSKWIQLWHGTPYKKLFFDSHEFYISSFNRNHKRNKQKDIRRWDYLLADSNLGAEKLSTAFSYDKSRILNYGYPRVQWLKDNCKNENLKNNIREKLNIPQDKKVLLYVPTWRDYNYRAANNVDLSYLLDIDNLNKKIKEDYIIIYKDHSLGIHNKLHRNIIIPDENVETQELILISDIIVSDYSSIIFDAISINIPFYLYINDFEKYSLARGVYEDIHELLSPFVVTEIEELSGKLLDYQNQYPFKEFYQLQLDYCNKNGNSYELLENKIQEILSQDD